MRNILTFLLLIVLLCTVQFSWAVIAYPGLVDYKQPDGTFVRVRMMGDEQFNWAETEDGYILLPDSAGYMTLAMHDNTGNLCASRHRIVNIPERSPMLLEAMKLVRPHAAFSPLQLDKVQGKVMSMRRSMSQVIKNDVPVVGTRKYLVILMQFQDVKFQISKDNFDHQLNDVHPTTTVDGSSGSVHDFYEENSFGQLDLQCDVVGVYTAANNMAYYGNNTNGQLTTLAVEALTAASKEVTLSDYDSNNDGYIDGVHIIFAGHGEEAGGGTDCIWSCEVTTTGYFCSINGKKMNAFSCTPELRGGSGSDMSYIGVICHEIGHALGTLDFYDTNYSTGGSYPGTGNWDVMGSGNWNNNGATPAHFNPYSKIYDFMWSDVRDGNKAQSLTLNAKSKGDYVRINTKTDGEYFLLEYRSKSGFDASIPGHGLMAYRASDNLSRSSSNTINAYHQQQFYPLCANASYALPTSKSSTYGTLNAATTPFPGTLGKTSLTDETTPSMQNWDGVNSGYPITDISEDVNNETATFNIAGGDGFAYGLEVKEKDYNSLQLGWGNDGGMTVMLIYNTTDTFGTPASQSYSVGNIINGGGTVLYVGTGTTYTHSGLEDGKDYYYRLYTKTDSSYVWSSPLKLKGHTKTKSIKSFPYTEDFESGVLDEGWRQEYIQGNYDWCVKKAWNVTSYVLLYDTQNIDYGMHEVTRAVMPTCDFSGHNNAILEFDYRNWVRDMSVVYRTSSDKEWQLLSALNNHYVPGTSATTNDAKNSEEHVSLVLPDITNEYEIAFVADFSWRGNSKSSLEMGTIDNIKVSVDFGAFTETKKASTVSSTFAEVEFMCYEGTETISSKGIEWSTNQSLWTKVSATENNQTVKLTSLPIATTIYYRSYVQTNKSTYVGNTLSFKTLEAGNGSGTEDDPFLIANATDWGKLVSAVNSGNDMAGIYYALSGSFALTPVAIAKEFNGHLDGQAYTITMTSSSGVSLITQLGANGVVENLNVECNSYSTPSSNFNTPFVLYNYGLITKCSIRIESLNLKNNDCSSGICSKNFGTISYCDSYIHLPIEQTYNYGGSSCPCQAWVGGVCWYNFGLIDHCSFDGDMACNNNSNLGGIAAINYYNSDEIRGHITNCTNRGTLRMVLVDGKSWAASIGGIAASSYGPIEYCINEGTMIGECNSSDCHVGGIIGGTSSGSSMSHCLNRGVIEVNPINASAKIGGVIGYNDRTSTQYCVNTGNFTITGSQTSCCNAIAGGHRDATMTGCYYDCNITDSKATKVTSWETTIQELNTAAGCECWTLKDEKPILSWEIGEESSWLKLNKIVRFSSISISGTFACSGDIKECGIEYRKVGEGTFHSMQSKQDALSIDFTIEELSPKTEYEIRAYMVLSSGKKECSAIQSITTDFANTGSEDDPVLISSADDLKAFAHVTSQGVNMGERIVRLTENLNMRASEGEVWTELIGTFNGEFDGGGHYIYNMKCVSTEDHFGEGLFTDGSSYIHDLHLYDVVMDITRPENSVFYVGTIVGICNKIERCSFVGKMKFHYGSNSWNTWCSAGGIAGCVSSYAKDCYALVDFDSNWTYSLGGIVGRGLLAERCYYGVLSSHTATTKPCGIIGNLNKFSSDPDITTDLCYYQEGKVNSSKNGTSMSLANMKDGTLLSLLNSEGSEVWTSNINGQKLDDGFPIFANQKPFPYIIQPGEPEPESEDVCNVTFTITADNTATVTGYSPDFTGTQLIVPDSVVYNGKKYPVTALGDYSLDHRTSLTSLILPEGLRIIGNEAINELNNLKTLNIPSTVDSICGTFTTHSGCHNGLETLTVSPGNKKYVAVNNVLYTKDMKNLVKCAGGMRQDKLVIPEGVENIFSQSFRHCSVKHLVLPSTLKNVSYLAFDYKNLLDTITIKATTPPTIITSSYFGYISSYHLLVPSASVELYKSTNLWKNAASITGYEDEPDGPVIIASGTCGDNAKWILDENYKLTVYGSGDITDYNYNNQPWRSYMSKIKEVNVCEGIKCIGSYAFYYNSSLTSVTLPNSLTSIGEYAFISCIGLTSIIIPDSVITIGQSSFYGCSSLTSITIPKSVTSIGESVCGSCKNLTSLKVDEQNTVYDSRNNCNAIIETASNTLVCGLSNTIIPNTVTSIGTSAFRECENLTSITIPNSVTSIGDYALDCTSLLVIQCQNPMPPTCKSSTFYNVSTHSCILYVPVGSKETYASADVWKNFTNIVEGDNEPDDPEDPYTHPDYSAEDFIVYAEDFTASKGKTVEIPVLMNNSEEIVGYQYDLYLPNGITIASDEDGELIFNGSRTSSRYPHTLEWQHQSDGSMRILSYSAKGTVFTGTSGDITKITLQVADSVEADSCFIAIKNIVLSKVDGSTIEKPASYAVVTFGQKYTRGDVNDDGKINVGDISCIASLILGTAADNLIKEAADANLDGKINVGDISSVAGFILNGSFISIMNSPYSGACFYSELTMPDMVMSAGNVQAGVLYLTNPNEVYSLQFDLCLPDGITIKHQGDEYCINQVKDSAKGHTLDWALQEDGSLRIINFSATNKCFADNQNGILGIEFVADEATNPGNYEIILKNVVLSGANGTMELGDKVVTLSVTSEATDVDDVKSTNSTDDIFSVTGIRKSKISRGLNIVNSRKIFVK